MTDDILSRALADLIEHPESSAREIAQRIGVRDDRLVFKALDNAAYAGRCQRSRWDRGPWRWEANCGAVYDDPDGRLNPPPCLKAAGHENGPDTDWKRHYHSNGDFKWPVSGDDARQVTP
ncbi:hypothetical protein AB0F72_08410 [Actinoplanes sp. NPDC023936]|uniref:hypothetical protein n=1 Tax=Actinoplanes sp. NPDC023936 TaxID=3154910 RepID=UPI0033CA994C